MTDQYSINHSNPGKVFIIVNNAEKQTNFENDIVLIEKTFVSLAYELEIIIQDSYEEILKILNKIQFTNFSSHSCVIAFVFSNGDCGKFYENDSKVVYMNQLFEVFNLNKELRGKPKLFFIQENKIESNNDLYNEADFLIAYGRVGNSKRQIECSGSSYINKLCSLIKETNYEIGQIIDEVNSLILTEENIRCYVSHKLGKKFFFKPDAEKSKFNKRTV